MFELTRHPMKILNLNLRTEMHGDKEVRCVDIKVRFDVPNTSLDELAGGLRDALYERGADDADLIDDGEHMTHVKYPQIGKFKWADDTRSGVGVHMHAGNGKAKGDLIFSEAKWDILSIEPHEGGTCECEGRAQVETTPEQVGKLSTLHQHTVPVSLDFTHAIEGDGDGEGDEGEEE